MLIRPSGLIRLVLVLVLCLGAVGVAVAQQPSQQPVPQPATPPAEPQTVSVKSNEVLLDTRILLASIGVNWDAWFEFTGFRKFDASQSDVKLNALPEKQKQDH